MIIALLMPLRLLSEYAQDEEAPSDQEESKTLSRYQKTRIKRKAAKAMLQGDMLKKLQAAVEAGELDAMEAAQGSGEESGDSSSEGDEGVADDVFSSDEEGEDEDAEAEASDAEAEVGTKAVGKGKGKKASLTAEDVMPYVLAVPNSANALLALVGQYVPTATSWTVVDESKPDGFNPQHSDRVQVFTELIARIRNCNSIHLKESNKDKLITLYTVLLEFMMDCGKTHGHVDLVRDEQQHGVDLVWQW